jgi:MSHA biogenesis protein MshP
MTLRKKQQGMSLVAAIFLLVVVAALGAFAVRIGMSQQETVNLSLLGSRALAAANSGVQWGAYRALNEGSCAASAVLNLTEAALNGFAVTVSCVATVHNEGGATRTVYTITATAQRGTFGSPEYVSRNVWARVT